MVMMFLCLKIFKLFRSVNFVLFIFLSEKPHQVPDYNENNTLKGYEYNKKRNQHKE